MLRRRTRQTTGQTTAEQPRNGGIGKAAKQVVGHARAITRLEVELAGLELKKKITSITVGVGLAIAAVVLAVFMVGFALAALAAGFATFLSTWLALLVVTLILFGLVAILGATALRRIKKGTPPVPEQAIREAKLTTEALKR